MERVLVWSIKISVCMLLCRSRMNIFISHMHNACAHALIELIQFVGQGYCVLKGAHRELATSYLSALEGNTCTSTGLRDFAIVTANQILDRLGTVGTCKHADIALTKAE